MWRSAKKKSGALLIATVLIPALALAQGGGANGIKVGEGRVHPFFDLELRFDSAAAYMAGPGTALTLQPEAITHLRPGLTLELPSSSTPLNFTGSVDYVFYTGLVTAGSRSASHLEAGADFDVAFNKSGAVELQLADHLSRSDRSSNAALGVGVLSFFNELKARVPIRPGGGALEITPKGAWALELFAPWSTLPVPGCTDASCSSNALTGMSYNNFRGGLDARWKFLPKTAVVLDSSLDTRAYVDPSNPSPLLLKATLGLAGLVSPKIATVAKLGWSQDFGGTRNAQTLIGQLELSYLMNELMTFRAGYLRSLEPVPTYGIYGDDRGYAEARMILGGKVVLHGYAAVDFLSFYGQPRNDLNINAELGADYQFTPWLVGSLGYTLNVRASSQPADSVNFARHEGHAKLKFSY